jgi:hypothetical protein
VDERGKNAEVFFYNKKIRVHPRLSASLMRWVKMPEWLNASVVGLTFIVMLVGLFGLLVPFFPGIIVIWLAALGYGITSGFTTLGIVLFVLITLLMIAGSVVDNILMGAGARKGGASWISLGVALVAGIAGTLLWPPVGGLIAAPAAVLLVEYVRARDWKKAFVAMRGMAAGWLLSLGARFLIGLVMVAFWGIWVYFR